MSSRPTRFRVIPAEEGMTLRNLLARRLRDTSKDAAAEIVRAGGVYVNRYRVRLPHVRVAPGERITVYPDAAEVSPMPADAVEVVLRDPSFVVVNKPAGVPVTATRDRARGTLAEGVIRLLQSEGVARPYVGIVHRLDQGASGLVLMTIRGVANKSLHQQFTDHRIQRIYRLGVRSGTTNLPPDEITCELPLVVRRNEKVEVVEPGTEGSLTATTHFRRLGEGDPAQVPDGQPYTLCEARLETGRTHQIRAHAAALGFPIVGDRRYGPRAESTAESTPPPRSPLLLHAASLAFEHPLDGHLVEVASPGPAWASPRS